MFLDTFQDMSMATKSKTQAFSTSRNRENAATAFRELEPVTSLIDFIDADWARLAAYLAYYGCARINAVLHVTTEDLRGGKIRFRKQFSKTKSSHQVPIAPQLAPILDDARSSGLIPKTGYLFPARNGNKASKVWKQAAIIDPDTGKWTGERSCEAIATEVRPVKTAKGFEYQLKKATDALIESGDDRYYGVSSHSFRRSFCQFMRYTLKMDPEECINISGHKTTASFDIYVGVQVEKSQSTFLERMAEVA